MGIRIFTIGKRQWGRNHMPTQKCYDCAKCFSFGDTLISRFNSGNSDRRTKYYHPECALRLNLITREKFEEITAPKHQLIDPNYYPRNTMPIRNLSTADNMDYFDCRLGLKVALEDRKALQEYAKAHPVLIGARK